MIMFHLDMASIPDLSFPLRRVQVAKFSPGPRLDYVRGEKSDNWSRQIAFIKDPDPLGPNYFVVSDSVKTPSSAVWRLWLTADQVTTGAQSAVAIGKEDVDTNVFFVRPAGVSLTTEQRTHLTSGITAGVYGTASTRQTGLIATNDDGSGFTTIIYPRLKTEGAPTVTELDEGKVIKVQSGFGTDYIFLSSAPFSYQDQDISFTGTVGLVQIRGSKTHLSLGAPGKLMAFGKTLNRAQ